MAAKLTVASLLLLQLLSTSPAHASQRTSGHCKQLDIPLFVTADSALYDIPRVDNDIEATAYAVRDSTRTTPKGLQAIIKNTTTSGTFNIHANLCIPQSSNKKDVLQIATHGLGYDSRYWDSAYQPEKHSYVEAALQAGYSILTYDRLGVGRSDHPDAYTVVQSPLELEILHQLTVMVRNGTLSSIAEVSNLPSKIIHIGHSYGSFLTYGFLTKYGNLTDGAILTGYLVSEFLGKLGSTIWSYEFAATSSPPFDRPSGYVVAKKNGVQNVFFGGDSKTAFTPELLDYGNEIKQPMPIGESASAYTLIGPSAPDFRAPVQYVLAEFDLGICAGDCKGLANMKVLNETYPHATAIEVAVQPNTGHGLPLHNNATAGFQLTFDFLGKYGL
jgi:pimeloyl-ACP methyl ester carboxylesterase